MAEIKFTDTLKCTATHNKLASASQIYDDVNTKGVFPDSQDLKQSSINKYLAQAINSASQNGGIYYNSKKTIAELTALTSVSKGDIFMITEDFNWDESSSFADKQNGVYPANTCVLIIQSATAAGKKSFVPLGTPLGGRDVFVSTATSGDVSENAGLRQDFERTPVGGFLILDNEVEIDLWSNSEYIPCKKWKGTYPAGSIFLKNSESLQDDQTNTNELIPLSPTKEMIQSIAPTTDTSALEKRIAALEAKLSMA